MQWTQPLSKGYFHTTVVKPFIHALIEEMKGAFDISNLPVLNAFPKLDPWVFLDRDSLSFESYVEELKVLHDFHGLVNTIYSKEQQCKLVHFMTHNFHLSLLLGFRNFTSYVSQQKIALSQDYAGKEKSLKSKFELVNAQKYKTRKSLRELEDEFYIIAEKVNNPLSVEYLLKDAVTEKAFPNI